MRWKQGSRWTHQNDENDKEIAGHVKKVDEGISKNYHLIADKKTLLHKVDWFGKNFGDTIRAHQFYVKMKFAACTVFFDGY